MELDRPDAFLADGALVVRHRTAARPWFLLGSFGLFFGGFLYVVGWASSVSPGAGRDVIDVLGSGLMLFAVLWLGPRGWRLGYDVDAGTMTLRSIWRTRHVKAHDVQQLHFAPHRVANWTGLITGPVWRAQMVLQDGTAVWIPDLWGGVIQRPIPQGAQTRLNSILTSIGPLGPDDDAQRRFEEWRRTHSSSSGDAAQPLPTRKEVRRLRVWRGAFGIGALLTMTIGLGNYGDGSTAVGVAIFSLTVPLILVAAIGHGRKNDE